MLIDIAPHEREAMYQMVLAVRAIADLINGEEQQIGRLKNWAQMVEDVVDRLDKTPPPRPEPSVPFRKA